jgi:hypothetical protein
VGFGGNPSPSSSHLYLSEPYLPSNYYDSIILDGFILLPLQLDMVIKNREIMCNVTFLIT